MKKGESLAVGFLLLLTIILTGSKSQSVLCMMEYSNTVFFLCLFSFTVWNGTAKKFERIETDSRSSTEERTKL